MCVIILQYIIKINYCNRFIHFERGKRNNKSDGYRMLIRYNFRELVFAKLCGGITQDICQIAARNFFYFSIVNYTVRIVNNVFDQYRKFLGPVRFGNDAAMIKELGDELNRTVIETSQYTGMPLRFREKLILSDSQTAECSKK